MSRSIKRFTCWTCWCRSSRQSMIGDEHTSFHTCIASNDCHSIPVLLPMNTPHFIPVLLPINTRHFIPVLLPMIYLSHVPSSAVVPCNANTVFRYRTPINYRPPASSLVRSKKDFECLTNASTILRNRGLNKSSSADEIPNVTWRIILYGYLFTTELRHNQGLTYCFAGTRHLEIFCVFPVQ